MATTNRPSVTAVAAGATLGAPVAIVLNWYLNTYKLKSPMPVEVAIATGSVISTLVTVWWHICAQILDRFGIAVPLTSESDTHES